MYMYYIHIRSFLAGAFIMKTVCSRKKKKAKHIPQQSTLRCASKEHTLFIHTDFD